MEDDQCAGLSCLPRGFATGEAAPDDMNGFLGHGRCYHERVAI